MQIRWYHFALAGLGALAARRYMSRPGAPYTPETVAEKLPLAKDLPTIGDHAGHYDIDGVSFDSEGVIVSGDKVKPISAPIS